MFIGDEMAEKRDYYEVLGVDKTARKLLKNSRKSVKLMLFYLMRKKGQDMINLVMQVWKASPMRTSLEM